MAPPANYHSAAVEKLRKYVRLLGSNLSNKNPDVLLESAKTYRTFAEQEYCERRPLIPWEERIQMLSALGHRPQFFPDWFLPTRATFMVILRLASVAISVSPSHCAR